jgi:hypothetical protein
MVTAIVFSLARLAGNLEEFLQDVGFVPYLQGILDDSKQKLVKVAAASTHCFVDANDGVVVMGPHHHLDNVARRVRHTDMQTHALITELFSRFLQQRQDLFFTELPAGLFPLQGIIAHRNMSYLLHGHLVFSAVKVNARTSSGSRLRSTRTARRMWGGCTPFSSDSAVVQHRSGSLGVGIKKLATMAIPCFSHTSMI